MYTIYYIKNNYMFRHFTLAIFRLRNKKNIYLPSYSCVRQIHTLQSSLIINTTGMTNLMTTFQD